MSRCNACSFFGHVVSRMLWIWIAVWFLSLLLFERLCCQRWTIYFVTSEVKGSGHQRSSLCRREGHHSPDGRNQNLAEGQEGLGLLEEIGSGLEMAAAQTQQIPRSDHWLQRSEPEYRECRSLNHRLVKRYCRVARTTARASV